MASNQRRQGLCSGCSSWTGWSRSWNLGCRMPSAETAGSRLCSRHWTSRSCLAGCHWLDRHQPGYQEPAPPERRWDKKKICQVLVSWYVHVLSSILYGYITHILSSILYLTHLGSPGCWMPNTSCSSLNHTEQFNFVVVLIESGVHQLSYIATLKGLCQQWPSLEITTMSRKCLIAASQRKKWLSSTKGLEKA